MQKATARCVRAAGAAWILVLAVAGCDGGSTRAPSGPDASSGKLSQAACQDVGHAAQQAATPALDTHQACQVASDCTSMQFSASCFQACERLVATSGVAAVEAAIVNVEATQCKTYHDGGCVLIQPPCAPRPPPPFACTDGICAYGTYGTASE